MEKAKDASRQFAAGGCAGLVEVCIMHPLDLVKTRFQIQNPSDPTRYTGLIDCFRRIAQTDGLSGFYKGILPPILAETPKRATKFFTFEQYKSLFTSNHLNMPMTFSLAGLCSGFTEAVVICPFEVVKVRLQSERDVRLEQQRSSYATARQIIAVDGLTGIYRGLTATLMRHGVWNMVYFGLYHSVKDQWPAPKEATANFAYRFAIGFVAGTLASIVNIPFDVAKSRIQGPQPVNGRKYVTCTQTLLLVYRQEGNKCPIDKNCSFLALYKGLLPKVLRLGPGGAIMLIIYENVYQFLKDNT